MATAAAITLERAAPRASLTMQTAARRASSTTASSPSSESRMARHSRRRTPKFGGGSWGGVAEAYPTVRRRVTERPTGWTTTTTSSNRHGYRYGARGCGGREDLASSTLRACFSTAPAGFPGDEIDDVTDGDAVDHHGVVGEGGDPRSAPSPTSSEGGEIDVGGADADSSSSPSFAWDWDWDPPGMLDDLRKASRYVHPRRDWDPQLCLSAAENYERHLRRHVDRQRRYPGELGEEGSDSDIDDLLSPDTARLAVKALLKSRLPTGQLRSAVRDLERLIGSVTHPSPIPLTDDLSYQLLEANAKSGRIGRTLALLEHRTCRGYPPRAGWGGADGRAEYRLAVRSILSAGVELRKFRNPYRYDAEQPPIDNPTRWLDAILVNMHRRGVDLDTHLANYMLTTYASTGRSGRAVHFFYRLERLGGAAGDPASSDAEDTGADDHSSGEDTDAGKPRRGARMRMHMRHPPHFYKLPSRSATLDDQNGPNSNNHGTGGSSSSRRSKLVRESSRDWSLPLTSAFAFADSLTHGACGHPPIELDLFSYNTLIKVCCHRGALWRAIHLLRVKMPELGLTPNTYSYNSILHGLARVGDRAYLQEFLVEMTNKCVPLNKYSVQAFVLGLLNVGDVGGAVTLVQDVFNQHAVLPPYTSHLDVIEVALANGLTYEARRHVYFLEQVRRWERPDFVDEEVGEAVYAQARNPKLSREALVRLFEYHGEELTEDDFM